PIQGALSQAASPPTPAPMPAAGPGGPPGAPPPAGMPPGPPRPPGPPPAAMPAGPPVRQPKPGNEGLINRVLGLISGETQEKQRMEHQKALVEAMQQGAAQALQGVTAMHGMLGGQPGGDPVSQIRGLMGQAGPPGMA